MMQEVHEGDLHERVTYSCLKAKYCTSRAPAQAPLKPAITHTHITHTSPNTLYRWAYEQNVHVLSLSESVPSRLSHNALD